MEGRQRGASAWPATGLRWTLGTLGWVGGLGNLIYSASVMMALNVGAIVGFVAVVFIRCGLRWVYG
ncbi:uncharacterized protein An07g06670 [Aspergillus niger]|uniref:Contig An07c0190, genomic contig n=2 Tax=Aspergillus niger TaxID=5061 RepID=A2QNR0_ASPNC|nr:uncharacterized protein An07g06670 [Aspergillus niger]CAK39512.1 unnamed protein product [Aspergillus niger]